MRSTLPCLLAALAAAPLAAAGKPKAPGDVAWWVKVGQDQGGFTGALSSGDSFGRSITTLGDVDGDGVDDLAVGAHLSDDGGDRRGSLWVLLMNADGTVKSQQEISDTEGGFSGALDNVDWFGVGAAGLGDLDGDSVPDLAVGASLDDDGGSNRGAVWILFLNSDGTVKTYQKISDWSGSFFGAMSDNGWFGCSLARLGDLDDDGNPELAVGAYRDGNTGAVWVLFLNSNGTVKTFTKIAGNSGGFIGSLGFLGEFGHSVANLGDVDGDGVEDLAVGARRGCDGGGPPCNLGHAWVLTLNNDGTVKSQQQIGQGIGGFGDELDSYAFFGASVAGLGDLDGDGVVDLAVGCEQDDDGGPPGDENANLGAVFVLFLNADGSVRGYRKISATAGNFDGDIEPGDRFALSLANLGDLDGDGVADIAAGSDDDGDGPSVGALYILGLADLMGFGADLPDKTEVGVPVAVSLSPIGGTAPYVVDLKKGALPPGIELLSDGTVQGTPTAKGKYKFHLRLTDADGSEVITKVLHKVAAPVKIAKSTLDAAKHGKSYSGAIEAKAGVSPFLFTVTGGDLPGGLYLDPFDGRIDGQPDEVGDFQFTVMVTDDAGGTAMRDFAITVKPTLKITTDELQKGKAGKTYDDTVHAKGGVSGYQFTVVEGDLPAGVSLASDGALTGTPTTPGKYQFRVRVTDESKAQAEKTLTLNVK